MSLDGWLLCLSINESMTIEITNGGRDVTYFIVEDAVLDAGLEDVITDFDDSDARSFILEIDERDFDRYQRELDQMRSALEREGYDVF